MKTWRELVGPAAAYLEGRGVPDATVAAELLAARLLKCGRGMLAGRLGEAAEERHVQAMRRGLTRLAAGEPLQYVLGEWDFRRLTLKCDRRALIPRPETEVLVGHVLEDLKARAAAGGGRPVVADAGTGSGCIVLALADEFPEAEYLGIDVSAEAVELAKENALRCGLEGRVKFAVTDGFDEFDMPETFDVIVSNPPYVTREECGKLDPRIRLHEPMTALDGGESGLDFYERYVQDALNLLKPGGAVFFEIGETQGEALRALLFEAGFDDVRIRKDYAGLDRYASGRLPPAG